MRSRVFAAALAATVAAWSGAASAAVVNYAGVIDLDPSMFSGTGTLVVPLPGGPMALNIGDTLQGTITFANKGRITVFNGTTIPGDRESISASFSPDTGTTAESIGTFRFLGRHGDYLLADTIVSNGFVGAVGFGKTANYTNSRFSFTGIAFNLTYVDDLDPQDGAVFTSHVTPGLIGFPFETTVISEGVPEPATWALLLVGFGAVGQGLRRRRALAAAA